MSVLVIRKGLQEEVALEPWGSPRARTGDCVAGVGQGGIIPGTKSSLRASAIYLSACVIHVHTTPQLFSLLRCPLFLRANSPSFGWGPRGSEGRGGAGPLCLFQFPTEGKGRHRGSLGELGDSCVPACCQAMPHPVAAAAPQPQPSLLDPFLTCL